jgi:hypothetical protein
MMSKAMRVFARRERPRPGAQLTLLEAENGWRYSLWATNRAAATKGWLGQNAYIASANGASCRSAPAINPDEDQGWPGERPTKSSWWAM